MAKRVLSEETKIKNRASAKKSHQIKQERLLHLKAEYARLSIIDADLAIELEQLKMKAEDLKKPLDFLANYVNSKEAEERRRKERNQKN